MPKEGGAEPRIGRRIFGLIAKHDFEKILKYYPMSKKHGAEAVNDNMEFNDSLDDFEEPPIYIIY